jgi:hypothetical protein
MKDEGYRGAMAASPPGAPAPRPDGVVAAGATALVAALATFVPEDRPCPIRMTRWPRWMPVSTRRWPMAAGRATGDLPAAVTAHAGATVGRPAPVAKA